MGLHKKAAALTLTYLETDAEIPVMSVSCKKVVLPLQVGIT